ncbi:MAG: hypothetical protein ACM31G_04105 [Flavobacteriales bacterium]
MNPHLSFDLNRLLNKNLMNSSNVHSHVEQIKTDQNISFVNFIYTYENFSYFNEILKQKGVHIIYPSVSMSILHERDGKEEQITCHSNERTIFVNCNTEVNFTFIPTINEDVTILSFDLGYIPEYLSNYYKKNYIHNLISNSNSAFFLEDCSKEVTVYGILHRINWLKKIMGDNHPLIVKSFKELQEAFRKSCLVPKFSSAIPNY